MSNLDLKAAPSTRKLNSLLEITKVGKRTLKRVPKGSRNQLAELLSSKLKAVIDDPSSENNWCNLHLIAFSCLEQPKRTGKKHRKSLASEVNKRIASFGLRLPEIVSVPTKPNKKLSDNEVRAKAVSMKINDGNIKAAVRIASLDDTFSPINEETLKKLKQKHPTSEHQTSHNVFIDESFQVESQLVKKCILSFPSGSAGGPDKLTPLILKDFISPATGELGKNLLARLAQFVNLVASANIPQCLRPYFFSVNLFALGKKDGGVRPIAVDNTLR